MMKKVLSLYILLTLMLPWACQGKSVGPEPIKGLYDLVVAKDGTGDFDNIQDAINAIRDYKPEGRQRILVRKGLYEEKVIVPTYKTHITLVGEDRDSTILVWHDHANMRTESGWPGFSLADEERAQQDGTQKKGKRIGTFQSYTIRVDGLGFECENMTISNDAMLRWNPGWYNTRSNAAGVGQAVAVHVEADKVVFRNCRLLGFQDTLFNGNEDSRQVFYQCYIEGTVDFLFGPATCWFEECELHAISNGYLTAASTPAQHPYGYVFWNCRVTSDPKVTQEYLGRPWRNYAAVLFYGCELPSTIRPEGWHNWSDPAREGTARFCEYGCTGAGANEEKRVGWRRHLSQEEAEALTPQQVLSRSGQPWAFNYRPAIFDDVLTAFYDERQGAFAQYKAGTLEPTTLPADPEKAVEPLVMNLKEVDCTTFVEYMGAAMLGRVYDPSHPTDSVLQRFVQSLRYRNGKRGNYASRKHYFSEWITDNERQGLLEEITSTLPRAKQQRRDINFMSQHRNLYPQLAASDSLLRSIQEVEQALTSQPTWFVPKAMIAKTYPALRHGDIVVFVCNKKGLDVFHCGFVWWPNPAEGEPRLLHASSVAGRVTLSPGSLADYAKPIEMCSGIRILRLK